MRSNLTIAGDRIVAALEYLEHEVDPQVAINRARVQLERARASLDALRHEQPLHDGLSLGVDARKAREVVLC